MSITTPVSQLSFRDTKADTHGAGPELSGQMNNMVHTEVTPSTIQLGLRPGSPDDYSSSSRPSDSQVSTGSFAHNYSSPGNASVPFADSSYQNITPVTQPTQLPVAFASPDIFKNLDPVQQEINVDIANQFNDEILSSGVSSGSPEYSKVWNTALRHADEAIEAQIGIDAFNKMQALQ